MQNFLAAIMQFDTSNSSPPVDAANASIWSHLSDALHQSLDRVLSLLISILPGILAFFVAMGVLALIGMAISAALRYGLKAVKFDDRIARSRGNADWRPATSPTALVARASFWVASCSGSLSAPQPLTHPTPRRRHCRVRSCLISPALSAPRSC